MVVDKLFGMFVLVVWAVVTIRTWMETPKAQRGLNTALNAFAIGCLFTVAAVLLLGAAGVVLMIIFGAT